MLSRWHRLLGGLRALWHRDRLDQELDEELRSYADQSVAATVAAGMTPEQAGRAARLETGSHAALKEYVRDVGWESRLESVAQDARYAARILRRSPAFTCAAIVTLALGIGANTAVFSIVDAVLIRPLPFRSAPALVTVGERTPEGGSSNVGYATLLDWRARSHSFDQLALMRSWMPTLVADGEAERLDAVRVSANYFDMLAVQPALGRGFVVNDDRPESWRVLVLSDAFWHRRFGGDPSVIGRTVTLNDAVFRIVGVMPPRFEPLIEQRYYSVTPEVWAPVGYDTSMRSACRTCMHLKAFGTLRPGVTAAQASLEMSAVQARLRSELPAEYSQDQVAVVPLQDAIAGRVKPALWILFGAVGFVLLIACANVANLLLARAVGRQRELAVRAALGAGRSRLARQLLTEHLLLTVFGAIAGAFLAQFCIDALVRAAPLTIPRLAQVAVDARVLMFTAGTALVTGVLFGLLPAFRGSLIPPQRVLATDGRTTTGGAGRARAALVVLDLALALVLLAGAGVMLRTVASLLQISPGFNPERVLTLQLSLVGQAWAEDSAVREFQTRLLDRVRALPGVEGAALAGQVPFGGNGDTWGFHVRGRMKPNPVQDPDAERYSVTPGYFQLMEIPLKSGRLLSDQDTTSSEPVMVVSQEAARAIWGKDDPLGSVVRVGNHASGPWRTVVGVVGDVDHSDIGGPRRPAMYLPQSQVTDSYLVLTIKTAPAQQSSLVAPVRAAVREIDPTVPVYSVEQLETLVARAMDQRRFVMRLLVVFAGIAVLLAGVGLYGVIAYSVEQRTREVGLRLALGATRGDIAWLVLTGGSAVVATGLGAGLLLAIAAVRSLGSLVAGVQPMDPLAIIVAVGVLLAVSLAAHWIPLRRALRIDPAIALRAQ
jgi:putative ABC transport system permease protein